MAAVAIVTGATRGLGLAVAQGLAKRGANVIFTGRDQARVEAHATEARHAGHSGSAHALDVASDASVRAFAAFLGDAKVEVLVNNAGIALKGFNGEVARTTIDTNYYGAVRVTDAVASRLVPGACVVMVSSGLGAVGCLSRDLQHAFLDPGLDRAKLNALVESFVHDVERGTHAKNGWPSSAYSVSKVALNAFTRILARELPAARVNAICPGWVATDMGGRSAPRSIEAGAKGILWAATLSPDGPTGGFFRDGQAVPW
jgi:carbonyl reductase 1